MERHLRTRHARTWILLGPTLLVLLLAMVLRGPRFEPALSDRAPAGTPANTPAGPAAATTHSEGAP